MATSVFIAEYLDNIDTITNRLNSNNLITNSRTAVLDGLKSFQITPAEKAKLYANFEIQFSIDVVTKVLDTAMQSGVVEKQIEELNARVALLTQQLATETENTLKLQKEIELLGSNKMLVDAQVSTESKRKFDVMASINIKNWQAESTKQSAMFEEARRFVLIKSTEFNNQIQKAKEENSLVNSLAVDDSFTITDAHFARAKTAMDAIDTSPISYTEELTTAVAHVNPGD